MNASLTLLMSLVLCASTSLLRADEAKPAEESKSKPKPKPEHVRLGMLRSGQDPAATELLWRNGEKIPGKLVSGSETELSWQCDLFTAPLRLKRESLLRVDFSKAKDASGKGDFRMCCIDGSQLLGNIEELTETGLKLKTSFDQIITVGWDQLLRIERISGGGTTDLSTASLPVAVISDTDSNGNSINRSSSGNPKYPLWYYALGGRATSPSFNHRANLRVKFPPQGLLDCEFTTASTPAFSITLSADNATLAVETWGDEVVLSQGTRFASAGVRIDPTTRHLRLRLGWDRPAGSAVLYGPDGKVWAELPVIPAAPDPISLLRPETSPLLERSLFKTIPELESKKPKAKPRKTPQTPSHLIWHNKGKGMIMEKLQISDWSGAPVPPVANGPVCVETLKEHLLATPFAGSAESLRVRCADDQVRDLPMADIRSIRWDRKFKDDRDPTLTSIWGQEGQFLRGSLMEIREDKVTLRAAFAQEPITFPLSLCRALVLPDTEPNVKPLSPEETKQALAKLDLLTTTKGSLHGTMVWSGGKLPEFRPEGGLESIAPAAANELTMTRAMPEDLKIERPQALLHATTAETFPIALTAVAKDHIEFTSEISGTQTLPTSKLHALQFAAPRVENPSFDGPGWQPVSNAKPSLNDKTVTIPPNGGIGHPYVLQGEDINFKMSSSGGGNTLRIRLFATSIEQKTGTANFIIGDFGGEIYCGTESGEDGNFNQRTNVQRVGESIEIRLTFKGTTAELWINGMRAAEHQRDGKQKTAQGTGLILEASSLWGNQPREISLKDFEIKGTSYSPAPPNFLEDAKREALLLPRVHREAPPKQILIGRNGDLLRGEIESMTSSHLLFRAGLESFKVPLDRVSSAVWVAKPLPPKEAKDAAEAEAKKVSETKAEPAKAKAPLPGNPFAVVKEAPKPTPAPEKKPEPAQEGSNPVQWLDLVNGGRLQFTVAAWNQEVVTGTHPLLGDCKIPTGLVNRISLKAPGPTSAYAALSDWKLVNTQDPVLPGTEDTASPLIGKVAADFSLSLLEGDAKFILKDMKGKVVVLDFWATWCGPCVKSLPGLVAAMKEFPEDKVAFLAVNQGETKEQVRKFLDSRGLSMPVGFDATQSVAKKYGVEGIPHTVVIGKEGKIVLVKTGYTPEGEKELAAAVQKELN